MTTPNGDAPQPAPGYPFETTHPPVISETPVQWVVDAVSTPAGQRLALTLRVPNASVSMLLSRNDARRFRAQVGEKIAEMTGLLLPGDV